MPYRAHPARLFIFLPAALTKRKDLLPCRNFETRKVTIEYLDPTTGTRLSPVRTIDWIWLNGLPRVRYILYPQIDHSGSDFKMIESFR